MSATALPIAAAGGSEREPIPAIAAAERIQQLQTLLAQVEQRPSTGSFAAALSAAQAGSAGSPATADSYPPASAAVSDIAGPGASATAGGGSSYTPLIEQAAARYHLDPSLLYGLIQQESGFDPSARSGAGALGLTQLMPSTASALGVAEPLDPTQSIEGGARYLSQLLQQFGGNTADALAAYNAGPGAVQQYGGVPPYPETQQYVTKVLGYAASFNPSGANETQPASYADTVDTTAIPSAIPSTSPVGTGTTAGAIT